MPALLFGSIGTVAETSELQREAFNQAFSDHDLDWNWSQDEYQQLLQKSGGQDRIAEYAKERGEEVDAAAIYETKSEIFRRNLADQAPAPRDGVADAVAAAREAGFKVGLVTTTTRANVDALSAAVAPGLDIGDFDITVDKSEVEATKPDPAVYKFAAEKLAVEPGECVAIENNLDGVSAAKAAGVAVVAFPGEDNSGHDFGAADERVESLDFAALRRLVAGEN
jgi:HAD superfamily hydrolase (TIGR01509 family)